MYALQKSLFSPPILCLPDFFKAFQLESSTFDLEIGIVILYNIKMIVLYDQHHTILKP